MITISTSPVNPNGCAPWEGAVPAVPCTPSARFSRDVTSGLKARAWVEEVLRRKLPAGDFATAFKDGVGLCELMNVLKPGTITKIEKPVSPFHQMANISCFLRGCRVLGVREHVLFETLDLFNENRLSQVTRCLFSLSELVRKTMPSYNGPFLAPPERPQVDPAVLHVVDISKGNVVPAPGWGGAPLTPGGVSIASTGGISAGMVAAKASTLPNPVEEEVNLGGPCLSPAAHKAGQLTYGIYEGGGITSTPPLLSESHNVRRAGEQDEDEQEEEGEEGEHERGTAVSAEEEEGDTSVKQDKDEFVLSDPKDCGDGTGEAIARSSVPVVASTKAAAVVPRAVLSRKPVGTGWKTLNVAIPREGGSGTEGGGGSSGGTGFGAESLEERARRRREAAARTDTEMEVALWIEGTTGETFPGKFWSSLKDGVILCKLLNSIKPGLVPTINTSEGTFPALENISAFLSGCREVGVAEHSLFDTKDLHEKRDMQLVVRCLHVLGAAVQSTVPEFKGPFLGKKSDALSIVNARGLRKRLGKGPGARGGIHTLTAHKGGAGEHISPGDLPIEQPDPTATMTPAESPSAKWARRGETPNSPGESGGKGAPASPHDMAEGLPGAIVPAVILEEEAGMASEAARVQREGRGSAKVVEEESGGTGRRNLAGIFGKAGKAVTPRNGAGVGAREEAPALRRAVSGTSGANGNHRRSRRPPHRKHEDEDEGEGVVSQIQRFIEMHTQQRWRVSGDMYGSLRDGWQLALLANALRPGAVRRVHNSIQPAKQVQNIASFLIASRRMGVARVLLFDIEDLYENKSQTRVARTLLALRALSTDPDFSHARPSSMMGTSLLITAAAEAKERQVNGNGTASTTTSTDVKR